MAGSTAGASTPPPSPSTQVYRPPSSPPSTPANPPPVNAPISPSAGTGSQLPEGGRIIFPTYRVVGYYGAPYNSGLGVLGKGTPEQAAEAIEKAAAPFAPYGRAVQPAMELTATVAQGSPGPDGDYSSAVSTAAVAAYLAVAKAHKMLLVLDFQPGRGQFLPQVEQFASFLKDPWVGVGLDPEWQVGPGQLPGKVIGSSSAAGINAVSEYLAGIVRTYKLPQKLFVVHQFTLSMLPDRGAIQTHAELATTFQADGHGSIAVKQVVYSQLAFPRPYGSGFKLFYSEDPQLMTAAQVMALVRRPDLITYE